MARSRFARVLAILLALALVVGLPVLAGCKKKSGDEPAIAENKGSGATSATVETTDTTSPDLVNPANPTADDGSSGAPAANHPSTLTVRLYWVSAGENALGVERTIPYTKAVATATMKELLAGPTPAEKTTWPAISTAIPAGSKLLGITVANGVAKVDLSKEFESGGGTFSVTARLAQVVYTLDQFPTIDAVEFYIEGTKVDIFSSEGLILDGPQRFEDYEDLLPVDA